MKQFSKYSIPVCLFLVIVVGSWHFLENHPSDGRVEKALKRNEVDWFKRMFAAGRLDCGYTNRFGRTLADAAASAGRVEILELLSDQGCDIFVANGSGHTTLMTACANWRVDTARYLIEKGCDVNQKSDFGYSALFFAAAASEKTAPSLIELLINNGAILEPKTHGGTSSLLHHAAGYSWSAFEKLLDLGAMTEDNFEEIIAEFRDSTVREPKHVKRLEEYARSHGWLE